MMTAARATELPSLPTGLSVVVPVYRNSATLAELSARLAEVLGRTGNPFELIMVDDGSPDDSWKEITRLTAQHAWIRGIRLSRNYGQHNALLCGIRRARYALTVTMDDDLQHRPESIPDLLAGLSTADVVYGAPIEERHGLLRDLASQITKIVLSNVMGAAVARHASAFRAFHTHLRQAFAHHATSLVSIDVLLTWATNRFAVVKVPHDPRRAGESNYTFWKLLAHGVNMVTGFSILPLQMASLLGLASTFAGVAMLFWVLGRLLVERSVPGFPFLASAIAIFSGVQLFVLGVIGEYLARVHVRVGGMPSYTTRETAGVEEA